MVTDDARASVTIEDGKASVVDGGEARVYVDGEDRQPLSMSEDHLTLRIVGDEFEAVAKLDARELDALEGAVHAVQEQYRQNE